jgi:hypothetical protein
MSIEKKSLISTLKTTKKANVAKEDHVGSVSTAMKSPAKVFKSPAKVFKSPAKALKSPAKVFKSPAKVIKNPAIKS